MALDTAAKRHSALSWGQPWRTPPRPSGTVDQAERQAAAFCYGGILASAAAALVYGPGHFAELYAVHPGLKDVRDVHPGFKEVEVRW